MTKKTTKIGIFGLGYVGLPLAVEFSKKHNVVGFDVNEERVKDLIQGNDKTLEIKRRNIQNKKLHFTSKLFDLKDCNYYILTVPTPIYKNKKPDLTLIKNATKMVASILAKGDIIIYESTVYPGLTEEVCGPLIEKESKLKLNQDFFLGYSPERINPGDKLHKLKDIVKITSGSNRDTALKVDSLYSSIISAGTYMTDSIKIAEAAKVIENTQRDINIALINELAMLFNKLNIDTNKVLDAAGTKWNFLPFKPGLVGGHCIGIDPYYLTHKAEQLSFNPKIILSGREINDGMSKYISKVFIKKCKELKIKNPKILILGFTFKEDCPDVRNTKVHDIYIQLSKLYKTVHIFDPVADQEEAKRIYKISLKNNIKSKYYDAVIISVAHKEFKMMGIKNIMSFMKGKKLIYDLKNVLNSNEDGNVIKL